MVSHGQAVQAILDRGGDSVQRSCMCSLPACIWFRQPSMLTSQYGLNTNTSTAGLLFHTTLLRRQECPRSAPGQLPLAYSMKVAFVKKASSPPCLAAAERDDTDTGKNSDTETEADGIRGAYLLRASHTSAFCSGFRQQFCCFPGSSLAG